MNNKYLLVDGKNLLWRAEAAMSSLNARGMNTGGLFGFFNILLRVVDAHNPTKLVLCWDDWEAGPAVRKSILKSYKDHGPPNPERVESQKRVREQMFSLMEFFSALDVKQARAPRWEADDVMGTLAKRYGVVGDEKVLIFTGDRDLLQCITSDVTVLRPMSDGTFKEETEATVQEAYGVSVKQLIDFKALTGDASDGYKGCPGIGEKSAARILQAHGGLRPAIARSSDDSWGELPERWAKLLQEHELAVLDCAKLATINVDVELDFVKRKRDFKKAMGLLHKWQMKSLLPQFSKFKRLAWRGA